MTRSLRIACSHLLAALVLLSGTAQGTVLCLGPGGHCHLETVVGASCGEQLAVSGRSLPAPPDGCPKGSKDIRLGIDTHRNDNTSFVAGLTSVLRVAIGVVEPFRLSRQVPCLSRFLCAHEARVLSIVLRC
jgi:hypothetical protein